MIAADIEDDIFTAVHVAQQCFARGEFSAVVFAHDRAYIGEDYWESPASFESVVVDDLAPAARGVFVAPIVSIETTGPRGFRPPDGDVDPNEREELWVLAWDDRSGLDVGRCLITRDGDGTPVFGDVEKYEGQVMLTEHAPGLQLMQALLTPTGEVSE